MILGAQGSATLPSSCPVKFKAGEAKRARGSQREVSEELAWADSWKQSAVCWSLASSFLEMAALANDYSFRQYSCLPVFSPKICSKGKDSNRPIQNKDPCQNSTFLTGVGREVYTKNLLFTNGNSLPLALLQSMNARLCLTSQPAQGANSKNQSF